MEEMIVEIIGYLIATGVGLGCGSFATMPYYRLPNGEACAGKWIGKKSHCVHCDHQLRTRDLVPVFNWLLTFGKCQFCGVKINPVYFFIESSVMILSLLIFAKYGFEQLHIYTIVLGLATCMVVVVATEYSFRVVSDQVLIAAVMFGFLFHSPAEFNDMMMTFIVACLAGIFYGRAYLTITGKELEHFYHPKLLAISGIWLPYGQWFIYAAMVLVLGCVVVILCKLNKSSRPMPFAFVLSSALLINLLYPQWYKLFI